MSAAAPASPGVPPVGALGPMPPQRSHSVGRVGSAANLSGRLSPGPSRQSSNSSLFPSAMFFGSSASVPPNAVPAQPVQQPPAHPSPLPSPGRGPRRQASAHAGIFPIAACFGSSASVPGGPPAHPTPAFPAQPLLPHAYAPTPRRNASPPPPPQRVVPSPMPTAAMVEQVQAAVANAHSFHSGSCPQLPIPTAAVAEPVQNTKCNLGGQGGELSPRDSVWKRYFGGQASQQSQHQSMLPLQHEPIATSQSARAPPATVQDLAPAAEALHVQNGALRQMSHPGIPRLPLQSVGVQSCRSESALGLPHAACASTERNTLPTTERAHPMHSPGPSRFPVQASAPVMPATMTLPMTPEQAAQQTALERVRLSEASPIPREPQRESCEVSEISVPPWRTATWPPVVDVPKANVKETTTTVQNIGSGGMSLQHTMGQFGIPDPPVAIDMAPLLRQQSAPDPAPIAVPETKLSLSANLTEPEASMVEESATQSFVIATTSSRQCQSESFLQMKSTCPSKEATAYAAKQMVQVPTPLRSHSTFVRQDLQDGGHGQMDQARVACSGIENANPREWGLPGKTNQAGEQHPSLMKAPERRGHSAERRGHSAERSQHAGAPPGRKAQQRQVTVIKPQEEEEFNYAADMVAAAAGAVNLRDLAELRSFRNPPAVVCQVLEPLAVLLGVTDTRWPKMRKLLDANLLGRLFNFDPGQLTPVQIDRVESLLQAPAFQDGSLHEKCPPAVALATWCDAVLQCAALEDEPQLPLSGLEPAHSADTSCNAPNCPPELSGISIEPNIWAMTQEELSRVRGLRFSRKGVGSIRFHGETDLRDDLPHLAEVVLLQPGEVVVYPNPGSKPPIGVGMNKGADILLLGCMPKTQGFRDPKAKERYRRRVKQMTEDKGAEFVDYDCETGTWKFRVSHF